MTKRKYDVGMKLAWLKERAGAAPPLLVDGGLALMLGLVGAAQIAWQDRPFGGRGFGGGGRGPGPSGPGPGPGGADAGDGLTYLLIGLCAASLIVRRRYPLAALAGVVVFAGAYLMRGQPAFSVQLIVLVALYSAVADAPFSRWQAILIAIGATGLLGLAVLEGDSDRTNAVWAMDAAWAAAAIFLGDSVRSRRAYAVEAERTRGEQARRRLSEERLQIARELHDVVGHNISLITVQAGAGEHVLYKDAEQARETFANIRQASHETLQELRSMVGVLRESSSEVERAPTVGLDALPQLVSAVSEAGQTVNLSVTGQRRQLAGVVDLSAYRILQEALTNTVRHAPQSRVNVHVDYRDDAVALEVVNDGGIEAPASDEAGGGHGLVGMRERVAAIGGRLDAGPEPGGGFHVRAVLPLSGAST